MGIGSNAMIKSIIAALAFAASITPAAAQFGPPELIESARQESKLVFYSAKAAEIGKPIPGAFDKPFPFVNTDSLRPPCIQCLQPGLSVSLGRRIRADVSDLSD